MISRLLMGILIASLVLWAIFAVVPQTNTAWWYHAENSRRKTQVDLARNGAGLAALLALALLKMGKHGTK